MLDFSKLRISQPSLAGSWAQLGNKDINENEADVLAKFADAFTTCSLNADEVGANVAKIAAKVNCHHHTFTCRKYCIRCRFNFPRFPKWKTVISRPRKE